MSELTLQLTVSGKEDGNGSALISFDPRSGQVWELDRLVVSSTSTLPSRAYLYRHLAARTSDLVDFTVDGNNDVAEYRPAERFEPGEQIVLKWTGLSPGASVTANAVIRQVPR